MVRCASARRAPPSRYVGADAALADLDGFVDTGDMVELHGDRYVFAGRRGGIINIGGLKVHPEEVEAVINRHPQVRMSLVRPKRKPDHRLDRDRRRRAESARRMPKPTRRRGARRGQGRYPETVPRRAAGHKVPAAISIVPSLDVAATGKLARRYG